MLARLALAVFLGMIASNAAEHGSGFIALILGGCALAALLGIGEGT